MPHTLIAQITYVIFDAIGIFSFWKGDRLQKTAGILLLLANTFTSLIQDRVHWMDPGGRFLILDLILLAFFIGVAVSVGRAWMIIAAAFQLLSTLSHPAAHFDNGIGPTAYIVIFQIFSYGVFITLGIGVGWDLIRRRAVRRDERLCEANASAARNP